MAPQKVPAFVPPWRWGVFLRNRCTGLLLTDSSPDFVAMNAIYSALKADGFRETYWQFVYDGQIGGLIKSPRNQFVEFHVRFFEGAMIYSEIELGRSIFMHFLGKRYYLNHYILGRIRARISENHARYLQEATERYKSTYDRNWPEWGKDNRFMTSTTKRQIRYLALLSDWRLLALVMFASVVSTLTHGLIILPLLTAAMIVIYLLAPRRN